MKSKPSKALRSTFMAFFRHSLSLFLLFFLRLLSLLCPGDRLPLAAPCAVVMFREGAKGGHPGLEARPSPRLSRGRPPQARTAWLMSRLRPAAASSRAAESRLMPSSAPPPGTSCHALTRQGPGGRGAAGARRRLAWTGLDRRRLAWTAPPPSWPPASWTVSTRSPAPGEADLLVREILSE